MKKNIFFYSLVINYLHINAVKL